MHGSQSACTDFAKQPRKSECNAPLRPPYKTGLQQPRPIQRWVHSLMTLPKMRPWEVQQRGTIDTIQPVTTVKRLNPLSTSSHQKPTIAPTCHDKQLTSGSTRAPAKGECYRTQEREQLAPPVKRPVHKHRISPITCTAQGQLGQESFHDPQSTRMKVESAAPAAVVSANKKVQNRVLIIIINTKSVGGWEW